MAALLGSDWALMLCQQWGNGMAESLKKSLALCQASAYNATGSLHANREALHTNPPPFYTNK